MTPTSASEFAAWYLIENEAEQIDGDPVFWEAKAFEGPLAKAVDLLVAEYESFCSEREWNAWSWTGDKTGVGTVLSVWPIDDESEDLIIVTVPSTVHDGHRWASLCDTPPTRDHSAACVVETLRDVAALAVSAVPNVERPAS